VSFQLVPNAVTLNDLERRPQVCVISQNSVAFGKRYVKVVEDKPIHSAAEM